MPSSRVIRVFLSSTFRDFAEERDLLVRRVFPTLRSRLKDRFVELVDVDLRWGITAEEAERGEVLPICLAEIDRARPYFIGMLGERYGWIPPPDGYGAELLERQPWLKKHQGGKSVTELEILHGALNSRRMKERAFFYFRSPAYARAKGGDYLPSPEDFARQTELKRRIRQRGLHVVSYANPEALAKRIERDFWKLLDGEYPASSVPDVFERVRLQHDAYASPRRRLYLGGESYQATLQKLLDDKEPRILIEGASGGGKSALLANFFDVYRKSSCRHLVHEHYLGASADAADPHALVRRLLEFIQRATNSSEEIPAEPQELMDNLPLWLAKSSAWAVRRKTRFVFVFDSLNSLTDQQDLRWWPAFLPRGISFVVSCLPGPMLDTLKGKTEASPQDKPPRWRVVKVRPLTQAQSVELLNKYLVRFNKKLPQQMVTQVQRHPLATNPLFLRTLAEELRLFGVHEELQKKLDYYLLSQTVDDLFERVLERVEKDCGKRQVKATMTGIWASKAGLTETEIIGIAKITPVLWAMIRHMLDEALLVTNGRITFAHDYLRIAVFDRYLINQKNVRSLHLKLSKWFQDGEATSMRVEEIAYQLGKAENWLGLIGHLTKYENIPTFQKQMPLTELAAYWTQIETRLNKSVESIYANKWKAYMKGEKKPPSLNEASYISLVLAFCGNFGTFSEFLIKYRMQTTQIDINGYFDCLSELGNLYNKRGDYKKSESAYMELISHQKFPMFSVEKKTQIYCQISDLYIAMGDLAKAKKMLSDAASFQKMVGANKRTFSSAIGLCESWIGFIEERFDDANSLLRKVISHTLQEEGKDAAKISTANNNLAMVYYNQGKFRSAIRILETVYEQDLILYGRRNYGTIIDGINLAWAREGLYDLETSIKMYRDFWELALCSLGENHSTTLVALSSISWCEVAYDIPSKHSAEQTLKLSELALGKQHPDTIIARAAVIWTLIDRGQLHDAQVLAEQNFRVAYDFFGPEHSQTGVCELDIVATRSPSDPEAYVIAIRALEKISLALGRRHIDTARALINLGVIMAHRAQLMDAQAMFKKASFIYSKVLPTGHPDRSASEANLEHVQQGLKKGRSMDYLSRLSRRPYFRRYIPSSTL